MEIHKLEVLVNEKKEIETLEQFITCDEEFADIFSEIIERIIIDNEIKISPKNMKMTSEKQKEIIIEKRNTILSKMRCHSIDMDYILSDNNSDTLSKIVENTTIKL